MNDKRLQWKRKPKGKVSSQPSSPSRSQAKRTRATSTALAGISESADCRITTKLLAKPQVEKRENKTKLGK